MQHSAILPAIACASALAVAGTARAQDDTRVQPAQPSPSQADRPSLLPGHSDVEPDAPGSARRGAPSTDLTTNDTGTAIAPVTPPEANGAELGDEPDAADDTRKHGKGRKHKHDAKTPEAHEREFSGFEIETAAGTFRIRGRVVARANLQRHQSTVVQLAGNSLVDVTNNIDSLDLSIADARVELRYISPLRWLSAQIEADLTNKSVLKDAYAEAKGAYFAGRAGQFKMPVSSIEMESPWALPVIDRGLVSEILLDRLDIAGRRPGFMFTARAHGPLRPRLALGAFQGSIVTEWTTIERKTSLLSAQKLDSQNLVARAGISIGDLDLGAYYEHRIGSPRALETKHYWTAGIDATADWVFSKSGLRLWIDGVTGASGFEHANKPADGKDAVFVTARALVAYRFGGVVEDEFYVEPFAMAGAIDPDLEVVSDLAWEASAGLNTGLWRRARLSVQGEMNKGSRNFPGGYFLNQPIDRYNLLFQAGVAF